MTDYNFFGGRYNDDASMFFGGWFSAGLVRATVTLLGAYSIQGSTKSQLLGAYPILNKIVNLLLGAYDIQMSKTTQLLGAYAIYSTIIKALMGGYGIQNMTTAALAGAYSVSSIGTTTLLGAYPIMAYSTGYLSGGYGIQFGAISTILGAYSIRSEGSAETEAGLPTRELVQRTNPTRLKASKVAPVKSTSTAILKNKREVKSTQSMNDETEGELDG